MKVNLTAYNPINNVIVYQCNNITKEFAMDIMKDSVFEFRVESVTPYEDDGFQKDNELYGEIDE